MLQAIPLDQIALKSLQLYYAALMLHPAVTGFITMLIVLSMLSIGSKRR
mgnify:CR=1 FL=1